MTLCALLPVSMASVWTSSQLAAAIRAKGPAFGSLALAVEAADISGSDLAELDADALQDLGIKSKLVQKKVSV